jgi:hypothetical protein
MSAARIALERVRFPTVSANVSATVLSVGLRETLHLRWLPL